MTNSCHMAAREASQNSVRFLKLSSVVTLPPFLGSRHSSEMWGHLKVNIIMGTSVS